MSEAPVIPDASRPSRQDKADVFFQTDHLKSELKRRTVRGGAFGPGRKWTRAQPGTTSLRAVVYMDEIFGYLPPTAMPPMKKCL